MGDLLIREATAADIPALLPLQKEIHDCHVAHHPEAFHTADPGEVTAWLQERLAGPNFRCFVALDGTEAVGYVCASVVERQRDTLCNPRRFVDLDQLSVRGSHRRRGVGRALVDAVVEFARKNGIREIQLSVWWGNRVARAFYRNLGFRLVREYYQRRVE